MKLLLKQVKCIVILNYLTVICFKIIVNDFGDIREKNVSRPHWVSQIFIDDFNRRRKIFLKNIALIFTKTLLIRLM